MRICPECKKEYESRGNKCPNCGFSEETPVETGEENWVCLTTVLNDIEFGMVAGLLEMGGIPVIRRARGIDPIIGVPPGGIEVIVPGDKYEEAVQLLNTQVDEEMLDEEERKTE